MLNGLGQASAARGTRYETIATEHGIKLLCLMTLAMPQRPVGLDMQISQPNVGLNNYA